MMETPLVAYCSTNTAVSDSRIKTPVTLRILGSEFQSFCGAPVVAPRLLLFPPDFKQNQGTCSNVRASTGMRAIERKNTDIYPN